MCSGFLAFVAFSNGKPDSTFPENARASGSASIKADYGLAKRRRATARIDDYAIVRPAASRDTGAIADWTCSGCIFKVLLRRDIAGDI